MVDDLTQLQFSKDSLKLSTPIKPNLSTYTDYREYLQDFYQYKKNFFRNDVRGYTYAHFSAAADIRSPNYLKLIIDGKRNLSKDMVVKFARALDLSKQELQEFQSLVEFNQAKDPMERNRKLKKLSDFRLKLRLKKGEVESESFDKIPGWVTWALFALVDQKQANFDLIELRKTLKGRVSTDEIKKALHHLFTNGDLVKNDETGEVKKGRHMMKTAENIPVDLVKKLQAELIYLGLESLFQDRPQDREFGSLTLSLTHKEFEDLKFELRHLRKRILKDTLIKREQQPGERVYQLNIQMFPVTE